MKINHYIRRSILFVKDYYIMPLRHLIAQEAPVGGYDYEDVYHFFSPVDLRNDQEIANYVFANNNTVVSNLRAKIANNPIDDITCVDCRLMNGKCVLHAAGGGANLANNAYIALKRAKGTNGHSLDIKDTMLAAQYDEIIAREFLEFYKLFPGRLHTHDKDLSIDRNYLTGSSSDEKKAQYLKNSISCGAIQKLFLDALGLYRYNFKAKTCDVEMFANIYDTTIESGNVDYIENKPHDASWAIKIDSHAIKEEFLLHNDPCIIVENLPTEYRSIKNPTNAGKSAYILDYEATNVAITIYLLQFIEHMYGQRIPEFDQAIAGICRIHGFVPTDNVTNYEHYKIIVKQKLFRQIARSTYTVATNIDRFKMLIDAQLSYFKNETNKPTLIALYSSDLHDVM